MNDPIVQLIMNCVWATIGFYAGRLSITMPHREKKR